MTSVRRSPGSWRRSGRRRPADGGVRSPPVFPSTGVPGPASRFPPLLPCAWEPPRNAGQGGSDEKKLLCRAENIYILTIGRANATETLAIPHFFPRRKKWERSDAPVKSRFPRRPARLRETQDSLRSNRLRFFLRKRLPARGFSTGEAPIAPSIPSCFTLDRGTGSEFQGERGRHTKKSFLSRFLHDIFSCFTIVYVHTHRDFRGIASNGNPLTRAVRPCRLLSI